MICQNFQRDEKFSGEPAVIFFPDGERKQHEPRVTLPEINIVHEKRPGPKRKVVFQPSIFRAKC